MWQVGRARAVPAAGFCLLALLPWTVDLRAVGGAMFGNQFQGRIFVGTSADALPISVDDPLMTKVLD